MNVNRTHRLSIVDKQHKVRQIISAKSMRIKKVPGKGNVIKIVAPERNKAA